MSVHMSQRSSLNALVSSLWRHRQLIGQMTKREVIGRYRGSALGIAWSFLNPLMMLSVYTFVFSVVFKSRWGNSTTLTNDSHAMFAIMLFVGLIVHGLFAEVINRSPGLIISNVNFVKKVIFPIEILPIVSMGAALFHSAISTLVLILAYIAFLGAPQWTSIFLPLVLLPLVTLTLGISWFLASIGVFLRDVSQTMAIFTTVMLFMSPVFFPLSALPERFRPFIMANPLTFIIEQSRTVLIEGKIPDIQGLTIYFLISTLVAWAGFAWFQKTRKGFADVL
ncbi:ABC transporter permease [Pseudomonas panipatensis]|uniref:Transport permease protein n=2 Tax=Pseudomonas panipatensis TaxID=428992 RepID=A0A1G8K265_9PSED|nr:ABC transporter permease [Pseudomonas panipatensis]SDI37489.1 lipopolysaccharide transport system permease protein [Pseudomonas panipatensis]SMP61176.1 lipopolysaccharide transport system permease protein [Pseudomonas panipatensis]